MTISSTTRKAGPFPGNDSTTVFPFAFKVFKKTDLRVVLRDSQGNEQTLVLDSDYSVLLNTDQDGSPGGAVTYPLHGDPLTPAFSLWVVSNVPYTQLSDLQNMSGFYPQVLENMADKSTAQIQQLRDELGQSLKLADTDEDGSGAYRANGNRISDLGDPVDPQDAATKAYVDAADTASRELIEAGDEAVREYAEELVAGIQVPTFQAHVPLTLRDGVDYTSGTSSSVTLPESVGDKTIAGVFFDAAFQSPATYTVSDNGLTLTFDGAIPLGIAEVNVTFYAPSLLGFFQQSGLGTVSRTFQDKMRERISIDDFGPAGDGVTDDTAVVQKFMNALAGRIGYFGPNTYLVNAITIPSGATVFGVPGRTVVKAVPTLPNTPLVRNQIQFGDIDTYPDKDITVDGIIFDGNGLGDRTAELVSFSKVQRLRVRNCTVRNVQYSGMAVGGSLDVILSDNELTGCGNLDVTAEGGPALWVGASGDTSKSYDVRISKNFFHDNEWAGMYGSNMFRVTIEQNHFVRCKESGAFINDTARDVSIVGNSVGDITRKYISASGFELGAQNITVSGNLIKSTESDCISLTNTQGVTITGNTLESPRQDPVTFATASCIGIVTSNASPNQPRWIHISGNTMLDGANVAYAAVSIGNSGSPVEFVHISSNNMRGTNWASGKAIFIAAGKWSSSCSRRNNAGSVDDTFAANQIQAPASSGTQTITGVGFRPSFVEITAVEASGTVAYYSFGMARKDPVNDAFTQFVNSVSSAAGASAGSPNATAVVRVLSSAGDVRSVASFSGVTDDGFTLSWAISAGQPWITYKAYP